MLSTAGPFVSSIHLIIRALSDHEGSSHFDQDIRIIIVVITVILTSGATG